MLLNLKGRLKTDYIYIPALFLNQAKTTDNQTLVLAFFC